MTPFSLPSHYDMGRHTPTPDNRQPFSPTTRTSRVLLTPRSEHHAEVDGVWWPWTTNTTTELHSLVTALTDRLGPVERIAFDWNKISKNQRLIDDSDGIVVTGPIPGQPTDVMFVYGESGSMLALVVIASGTVADHGYDLMRQVIATAHSKDHKGAAL